jgi:dolichol-phosphate mannosyltransferase
MPELTVVVPTFNERDNVEPLLAKLDEALSGISWEALYVDDDSPDGTAAHVRSIAQRDPRVRCVHRVGRRGLSTAVIEGIMASSSPYVAVIDGDMQHDERILPNMLETLKSDGVDIVIGSRHVEGGGLGDWDKSRVAISDFATRLSRLIVPADLTDPMSGFFMVRRSAFEETVRRLSGQGFKILLDIFASAPRTLQFRELGYQFRTRQHGESKLDALVVWEYLMLILDKWVGHIVPVRFVMFAAVGGTGVVVHFVALYLSLLALGQAYFAAAQAIATVLAMTSNFILNNLLTYRDRRLKGIRFLWGLLSFYAVCSVGAVANVGVANFIFEREYQWWIAGGAGVLVGVVWNFAASSIFTWRKK